MLLGYEGAERAFAPEPVMAYWFGWRLASVRNVVMPELAIAAGMLGFSTPECSPVTTADGSKLVMPLAAAKEMFFANSDSILLLESHPPLAQRMLGLVAVG